MHHQNVVALTVFMNTCAFIIRTNTLAGYVPYISNWRTLIHQDQHKMWSIYKRS